MGILEFLKKPADNSELKNEEAVRAGVRAELRGQPEEAKKLYAEGGRPELEQRVQSPETVARLAANETEKFANPEMGVEFLKGKGPEEEVTEKIN
jgi:hypothetical protein